MTLIIKNFEKLIEPALKRGQNFVSYRTERLLSSGENYGSIMLKVEVNVVDEKGRGQIIQCVAKTCPPRGYLWDVFNTRETFKAEISIYNEVIPRLNDFAKANGGLGEDPIDFVPKYLASRISLTDSNVVDEDAVLVLENLKVEGYDMADKYDGFDLDCARLILKDLATFHAVPIAFRTAKPEDFRASILPRLGECFVFEMDEKSLDRLAKLSIINAATNKNCVPYLSKLEEYTRKINVAQIKPTLPGELFKTIVHNDYWLNNTMLKFRNGKAKSNKMVDFQINDYSSLTHDLVFFLYSSVELSVLNDYLDELFRFYYDNFIQTLKKLKCNVEGYSFEAMMEEAGCMAKEVEFPHLIMMLPSIFKKKEKSGELAEGEGAQFIGGEDCLHENYARRIQFVLLDFVRRRWI